jgi:parallel beta-helix repeat protein
VDAVRGNDANPGTRGRPWKTIQSADDGYPNVPSAGECINILPGEYKLTQPLILGHGGDNSSPTGYVVYRSTTLRGAHLIAEDGIEKHSNGDLVMVTGPYVIVDGLDVDGNRNLTRGHGIDGCVGGGRPVAIAHHFIAINNLIHDMGGAGLSSCSAEYITWLNNEVYHTSATSLYQASGISVWKPRAVPISSVQRTELDMARFGIIIAYNLVHDNAEGAIIPGEHTDGNGIIIDTTLNSAKCATCDIPYAGNVLVLGNLSYNNGGGGIHVFLSKNVVVTNNTVFNNYRDVRNPAKHRGELSNIGSFNTEWLNNIAIARPGPGVLAFDEPITTLALPNGFQDGATFSHNLTFGAENTSDARADLNASNNLIGVDPKLVAPAAGDFRPLPGSPVVKAGSAAPYLPQGTPNIGAY